MNLPPLFMLLVVAPTLVAAFYYFIVAAPMYVSEARFVVRVPSQATPTSFDSLLQGVGLGSASQSSTDSYIVHEYVMSREAVGDLIQNHDLKAVLSRASADFLSRFPGPFEKSTFEGLYRAYPRYVSVGYNGETGISTLNVKAFSAKDASDIANALLDGGEKLINRLNDRATADSVAEARSRILESENAVTQAETALTNFRNRERLIDPTRSSAAGLELTTKLEGQLATLRAERAALAAAAPRSPQLAEMDRQIVAFQGQLGAEQAKIAGQDTSLAPSIGEYERLMIDRDFAVKELTEATLASETSRLELHRKRLYLERIVPPNAPDSAVLPRRFHSTMMVLLTSLLLYGIVALIMAGLREHGQA